MERRWWGQLLRRPVFSFMLTKMWVIHRLTFTAMLFEIRLTRLAYFKTDVHMLSFEFSSVAQSCPTPWTAAHQASLSITISQSFELVMPSKRVQNAVLGCNLKNNRIISACSQGKPFNSMVIQIYAATSNAGKLKLKSSVKTYKTF